jgi:hypothetical protein
MYGAPARAVTEAQTYVGTFTSFGGFFSSLCITQSGSGMVLETCQGVSPSNTAQMVNVGSGLAYWTLNGLCLTVPNGDYAGGQVNLATCTSSGVGQQWGYNSGKIEAFPGSNPAPNGYCLDTASEENTNQTAVLSHTVPLIIDRIFNALRGDPPLLEDEQLVEGASEHDPAWRTVAAQVTSERGECEEDLLVAGRRAERSASACA